MRSPIRPARLAFLAALALFAGACAMHRPQSPEVHRWWSGLGPVLPHDSFPADCKLCHTGSDWNSLRDDFHFDHLKETGVPLVGAHEDAQCLRCHNDRGPVAVFEARGCQGCHEDLHLGELGARCTDCHDEETWFPHGQIEKHYETRFPLVGVHAQTACRNCHPGAEIGRFRPADTRCEGCHQADLQRTTNHVGLGWIDHCERCHLPTSWNQAEIEVE